MKFSMKNVFAAIGSLFLGMLLIALMTGPKSTSVAITPPPSPSATKLAKPSEAQLTLEKRQAKFGKRPEISAWDSSYRAVKTYLSDHANDPDSIKFAGCGEVMVDESKGWLVGCKWRGTNSFGGVVTNFNWFIIKHERVIDMLPATAYKP